MNAAFENFRFGGLLVSGAAFRLTGGSMLGSGSGSFFGFLFKVKSVGRFAILFMGLFGALAACRSSEKDVAQFAPDEIGLSLSGLNYTDMPIGSIYVNGSWGGGFSRTTMAMVPQEVLRYLILGSQGRR